MRNRGRLRNWGRRLLAFGGGTPAAAWTPASLASLAAWYTASPAWCFTDAGGTVAAGNTDPVRVFTGRSGYGPTFSQGTSANRPSLALEGDSRWGLSGDAVNDYMTAANVLTGASVTGFLVGTPRTLSAAAGLLGSRAASQWCLYDRGAAGPGLDFAGADYNGSGFGLVNGTRTLLEWDISATAVHLYGNGTLRNTFVGQVVADISTCNLFQDGIGNYAAWDVHEIVLCSSVLSAADRALVEAYLNAAWAVY